MPQLTPNRKETLFFTAGRSCPGPTAVVLHQTSSGIEVLSQELAYCKRPLPTAPRKCHHSFHYALSGCNFAQFVDDDDTAWGFYYIPTPVCPEPPCPIIQTCDGLGADQYNPDFDGVPATPTVAAGSDLTANCSVIHFAYTTGVTSPVCPVLTPQAYSCLVQALCYVFDINGITPNAGSTLLTHVGELVDLDLNQLEIDILACLAEPDPTLVECTCLPLISEAVGNVAVLNPDGVFVPAGAQTPITVVDSSSINLTASGVNNHTLTAVVTLSPDAGNTTEIRANGVYTPGAAVELNGCNGSIDETDTIVTAEGFDSNTPTQVTANIWASGSESICPARLQGVPFSGELPLTNVVLGVDSDNTTPTWARLTNPPLAVNTFTQATLSISPDTADVWLYTGVGDFTIQLNAGLVRNSVWIKNISGDILTINPADGTVDGVASVDLQGTIPGGYPFGNNGGESVHLVFDGSNWFVI